jgi:DNA-binding response OmpR family regulator
MEEICITPEGGLDIAPVAGGANFPLRILVVEDDPDIRRLNELVLLDCGYQVDVAPDGAAAWQALQLENYDLMVTDNQMPKMSGVELLQKLHAASINVPVIMATGTPPEEELKRRPWLQIKAMLLKPYTIEELVRAVREVLHAANSLSHASAPLPPPPS